MTEHANRVEPPLDEPPLNRRCAQSVIVLAAVLACAFFIFHCPGPPANRENPPAGISLDLNRATAIELSLVPGIGPALAERIVENRSRLGDFPTLASVSRVHGIGERTMERIATLCVVNN